MDNFDVPPLSLFSWDANGNIGDDWIAETGRQLFPSARRTHEKRRIFSWPLGSYGLANLIRDPSSSLILWGGGWLASDRPDSTTLSRWKRHLSAYSGRVLGFGLGIGPFEFDQDLRDEVLEEFSSPLVVRTRDDLFQVPPGVNATLGCDASLLDLRMDAYRDTRIQPEKDNYSIFSFPRYAQHWAKRRPWLTEEFYQEWVEQLVGRVKKDGPIVLIEFDDGQHGPGDADYWKHLDLPVHTPNDIWAAAKSIRKANAVYTGRLHCGILAAVLGRPVMALAYHHKFRVLEELGVRVVGLDTAAELEFSPSPIVPAILGDVRERGHNQLKVMFASGKSLNE